MRTALTGLTNIQAQKELNRFTLLAIPFSAGGIIVSGWLFGWLGGVGMAFSARAFLLTFHASNKDNARVVAYRIVNVLVFLVGLADIIFYYVFVRR